MIISLSQTLNLLKAMRWRLDGLKDIAQPTQNKNKQPLDVTQIAFIFLLRKNNNIFFFFSVTVQSQTPMSVQFPRIKGKHKKFALSQGVKVDGLYQVAGPQWVVVPPLLLLLLECNQGAQGLHQVTMLLDLKC